MSLIIDAIFQSKTFSFFPCLSVLKSLNIGSNVNKEFCAFSHNFLFIFYNDIVKKYLKETYPIHAFKKVLINWKSSYFLLKLIKATAKKT